MKKPFSFDINVFFSCILFWCYVYCVFIIFFEFISLSAFFGVLLILIAITTYLLVWYFALPQPDNALVTEILGKDPKLMKFVKSSNTLGFISTPNVAGDETLIVDDDKDYFTVIGHRGAGLDAPENSLAAFRQCHEKGCKAIEFDLVLTVDDVPVLFHDDTVDRLTNATGLVQQMTWDQLKALDISEKHPLQERFVGERIALFSDAVKLCLDLDMRLIIDIKDDSTKVVQVIVDTFKQNPLLYKRALVSSFNPFVIYMIRARDPRIVCSLAWRPYYYSYTVYGRDMAGVRRYPSLPAHLTSCLADMVSGWLLNNVGYYLLGLSAVLLHKDCVTSEVMTHWEKRNVRVIVWTVNRPHEKLYFSRVLQVAYITDTLSCDRPY